jgi:hypothetical protein
MLALAGDTTPPGRKLCRCLDYYHQQYLSGNKNPNGYCPDHGTGVSCPIGVVSADG